jgi:hypothetical protein
MRATSIGVAPPSAPRAGASRVRRGRPHCFISNAPALTARASAGMPRRAAPYIPRRDG